MKKIALVVIAYDEDKYLSEWCQYYLALGFDDIHIFQNNWRWKEPIINDRIILHEFDGKTIKDVYNVQIDCYQKFIEKYKNTYEWAAFFDVDEFLCLKKHSNIKDFINAYNNTLIINWAMFGSNQHKNIINETSQLKRFTKRKRLLSYQGKAIVKLEDNIKHNIHYTNQVCVDVYNKIVYPPFNSVLDDNLAYLNHFYVRSYEEFLHKRNRGAIDTDQKQPMETFSQNDFNEIEDNTALNFYLNERNN